MIKISLDTPAMRELFSTPEAVLELSNAVIANMAKEHRRFIEKASLAEYDESVKQVLDTQMAKIKKAVDATLLTHLGIVIKKDSGWKSADTVELPHALRKAIFEAADLAFSTHLAETVADNVTKFLEAMDKENLTDKVVDRIADRYLLSRASALQAQLDAIRRVTQ